MRKTLVIIASSLSAHRYYFPGERHHFNPDDIWFKGLLLMPERIWLMCVQMWVWSWICPQMFFVICIGNDYIEPLKNFTGFVWTIWNQGFLKLRIFSFYWSVCCYYFPSITVIVNVAAEKSLDRQRKPSASKNESKMSWTWQFSTFLERAFNPSCSDADLQALASGHLLDFLSR